MVLVREMRCANCGKIFEHRASNAYKQMSSPFIWCQKCTKVKKDTIKIMKQNFKKQTLAEAEAKDDAYMKLAQIQVLLDKTKDWWSFANTKNIQSSFNINNPKIGSGLNLTQAGILNEVDMILKKSKIPKKYLIAESL